ncbi:class I SAM-dependent methyltransferase [Fulvimarina sp. 2208YS6-2-32]|uniref:Class I SAM-dependent methyltransferase n=1 Tax=Fulvimarina uroteuthidis TaxID=3098149 RepID=A0ABU5I5F8_9HYPH|nr:class I SAM-dependent methyltransferase [Fulvimarina sp. 2208YS6-2-32]MDY8109386.1 class I SAM-dependent methyltransferase [Fulvimarina sp. 2208YS6-2-32]
MSGFEAGWLSLREPADRRARNETLLLAASGFVSGRDGAIVDLGCGTGSTFRALDPVCAGGQSWVFVDDDPRLLERARELQPADARKRIALRRADLSMLDDGLFEGASLVTASALFDLVSERFIEAFARAMRDRGLALYSALSVDGRIAWDSPHALDGAVVAAFTADQRRDKGFGEGLGADAAIGLERAFEAEGYAVRSARSDWVLGRGDVALQDAFHEGFAGPAQDRLGEDEIAAWLRHRAEAARAGSTVRIGHRDMLALPAR